MPLALFDLDNTLVDRVAAFRTWARAFAGEAEIQWLEEADGDGFVPREEFFARVRERYGLAASVEELVATYLETYPHGFRAEPEVQSALRDLRARGWKIGIVSNGSPSQALKIEAAGLTALVDGWAISEVVGSRKPEPGIFEAAAEACGASLEGAWVVGDTAHADIAGAVASGLRSVWIARGRDWPEAGYRPTAVAETIAEAVDAILATRRAP